ncbi:MAG: fused MFS/spermidine synthase [Phycisphaerales bacterium]
MVGRLVLPSLGGSPAVWNTVMVFFQASLLAGYALAHVLARQKSQRIQVTIHAFLALTALLTLPIGYAASHVDPAQSPVLSLLVGLVIGVGLPALTLATMSPLLQRWYASLGLKRSADPYFLYAASNVGSLIGLLGYPLVIEPLVGLSEQTNGWSICFLVLVLTITPIWIRLVRKNQVELVQPENAEEERAQQSPIKWVVLALVPSSLLLGVTQHITTDIAAMPLFWAIPLALYLVTFIVAFSGKTDRLLRITSRAVPILAVAVTVGMLVGAKHPLFAVLLLHLAAFFAIALGCHTRLYQSRPKAEDLTRYYLFISIGGVLGGSINALIAPNVLSWVAEYPIMIALGAGLAVGWPAASKKLIIEVAPSIAFTAVFAAGLFLLDHKGQLGSVLLVGAPALVCFLLSTKPARFALALMAAMILPELISPDANLIYRERTFFGVHAVYREPARNGERHVLRHGGTIHGLQNLGSATPQTYYHPTGPIGVVFERLAPSADIAAIGLGVGSVASLARPGDALTFYEIDSEVHRIASDPALFTFLSDSPATIKTVIGDGRLTIQASDLVDLVIIDAFTSDAIPAHLMTAEALGLYADKLKPGGLIAMHLSNRYLELEPVVAATAINAGLVCAIWQEVPNSSQITDGKQPSVWALLAKADADLSAFTEFEPVTPDPSVRPWTDDYANVLGVMRLD